MNENIVSQEEIDKLYEQLNKDARVGSYNLNPDIEFTKSLVRGLLTNEKRYGYQSCPCRLASGANNVEVFFFYP